MKKLNNGVVPPVPTFHFERIRIAKEGNNHHENEYMARGGDRRAGPSEIDRPRLANAALKSVSA